MKRALGCLILALAALNPGWAGTEPSLTPNSVYHVDAPWTEDSGRIFHLEDLRGHPAVLAMIYTRCGYACPMVVATMRRIEAALPGEARRRTRFVLISFDTEHDTPAVLKAYRKDVGLPDAGWTLACGDSDHVRELAMVIGMKYRPAGDGMFAHSTLITVLNPNGEIACQLDGLRDDLKAVLAAIGKSGS